MKRIIDENASEKLNLIKQNLQEVIGEDVINGCFEQNGTVNLYWGTAPTGRPHVGYFLPMIKIADFLKSECILTILFADLHAYLDNMKAPLNLLEKRTEYYESLIKLILKELDVPLDKLRFIRGMDFQLDDNYTKAVYQLIGLTTIKAAKKAGCDVVKQTDDTLLSAIVYPLLQALDEEFLGVDVQFGGADQRKIFMYAEKYLPYLKMAKRAHLMNPMMPGLIEGKMSASNAEGKIDLLDSKETLRQKINGANCKEYTVDKNGLLFLLKYIGLPLKKRCNNKLLNKYNSIENIINDFTNKKLQVKDIKNMATAVLWSLMEPLNKSFISMGKTELIKEAYPDTLIEDDLEVCTDDSKRLLSQEEFESLRKEFPEILDFSLNSFPMVASQPNIMWSCRATGEPHVGYLIPIRKLANLSKANWTVTILIEDIGAFLHSKYNLNKPSFNLLKERGELYSEIFRSAFEFYGGNLNNLRIVLGSEFQCSKKYALLMYQLFCKVKESECIQVLKLLEPNESLEITELSSLIYPCISVLDQYHFEATVRLFGERQHSKDLLELNQRLTKMFSTYHKVPIYVSHKNVTALNAKGFMNCVKIGAKTASKDMTCLSICDKQEVINAKMKKALFDLDNFEGDPTLDIIEKIILPHLHGGLFCVDRTEENGDDVFFSSIAEIKAQLKEYKIHPEDIKSSTAYFLSTSILQPICQLLSKDPQMLLSLAFPEEIKSTKTKENINSLNKLHLRIAVVESIFFKERFYHFELKCGIDRFKFKKQKFYGLTPHDYCIIAVTPSTVDKTTSVIGILTNVDGISWNMVKKSYLNVVTFQNQEIFVPHLQVHDTDMIIKEIETNIAVKGKYLTWITNGSIANEIEFKNDKAELTKVSLSLL